MPLVKKCFVIEKECLILVHLMKQLRISQSAIQRLFDRKRVYLNGKLLEDKAYRGKGVAEVVLFEPQTEAELIPPMFRTKDFAIFDKPPFLLSHPKDSTTKVTLLDSIKYFLGKEGNIVHRLDFETSGLIIAATSKESEVALKELFEKRLVKKWYEAIVRGVIEDELTINAPILQNNNYLYTKEKALINKEGKSATTKVVPLSKNNNTTLVRLYPKEGRLHQLRVHLNYIGHPIVGDPIYGVPFEVASAYLDGRLEEDERVLKCGAKRVMLCAKGLAFTYKGEEYLFESKERLIV